ncbi:MAG: hypothetical protein A2Y86_04885 [Candidatus Aminicenantes bacterium RBG_13_62_12]|nr:MAG: hypothetical protein A2Y86_04885 [Candidatus Aminicenantes bacterium RBG_13_62_12]
MAVVALLAVILTTGLTVSLSAQKQAKTEPKVFIPKEVKAVMEAGLLTQQPRLDIPFAFSGHLYLPAAGSFQNIFCLEIANRELGFVPLTPAPPAKAEEKAAEDKPQAEPVIEMLANFELFIQFREISGGLPGQVYREIFVPCEEKLTAAEFNPDKVEKYYVAYPLPAGKYLAAFALTSIDLKKIGTQYFEFSTPDPASFSSRLDTTPVFSAKAIDRMDAPDRRIILHKNYFTFATLKITPILDNVIGFKENFDIFYFNLGAQPNAEEKYSLETNFEVKKGEETVIRFAPVVFPFPIISQPLPLKRMVVTKTEAGETQEEKDLEPGSYILVIKIQDRNSGYSTTKNVPFEVK